MNAYVMWLAEELARKFQGECRVLTMQYDAENMPENDAEARVRLQRFRNNGHSLHRRRGLVFRIASATDAGDGGDTYTHVAVVNLEIGDEELRELWPYGPMEIRRETMDEAGAAAMAQYLGTLRGKTEERDVQVVCPHNEAICCDGLDDCEHCGWNPKVAEERKRQLRQEDTRRRSAPCRGNDGLCCSGEGCEHCGWNPEVSQRRIAEMRQETGVVECFGSNRESD